MGECNLGVTYSKKKAYLYVVEGNQVIPIAQLRVSEEEFWGRLGRALKIKFCGAGGLLDMSNHIKRLGVKR